MSDSSLRELTHPIDRLKGQLDLWKEDEERLAELRAIVEPRMRPLVRQLRDYLRRQPYDTTVPDSYTQREIFVQAIPDWLLDLLSGPYDGRYYERHFTLGLACGASGLDGPTMIALFHLLRRDIRELLPPDSAPMGRPRIEDVLFKVLDLELAILVAGLLPPAPEHIVPDGHSREQLSMFAETIAHRIRNPLAGVSAALQVLATVLPSRLHQLQVSLLEQISRLDAVVNDLIQFSRPVVPTTSRIDLRAVACNIHSHQAARGRTGIVVRGDGEALGDSVLVTQALHDLLENAWGAAANRVEIHIRPGRLEVFDNGSGIPAGDEERIFKPFFTTHLHTSGLGLSNARRWIEAMGGQLTLCPSPLGGAGFQITLPTPARGSASRGDNVAHIG